MAALANVGGGLVGGDTASIAVDIGADAAALVTSQAAEKVYRSTGADCRVTTRLKVAQGGWLEWCPQETILFDRARLRRTLRLDLVARRAGHARRDLVLGRHRLGRAHRAAACCTIGSRSTATASSPGSTRSGSTASYAAMLAAAAGLGGARSAATFVYAAPDAAEPARPAPATACRPTASAPAPRVVNGLLVARFLAAEPLALRRAFALFWCRFRAAAAGLPPVLPRLWHV